MIDTNSLYKIVLTYYKDGTMSKCKCKGCDTQRYYDDVRRIPSNDSPLQTIYTLKIIGPSGEDGHSLSYTKKIDVIDVHGLLQQYFGIELDVDYLEPEV